MVDFMRRCLSLFLVVAISTCMISCLSSCTKSEEINSDETDALSEVAFPLTSGDSIHTIAFISDTQRYDEKTFNEVFKSLVSDKEKYNIEYVIHTGDIIQESDDLDGEWQIAKTAISQLDGIIPYGILAGNHDQETNSDTPFALYSKYFGDESYKDCDYFAGSYSDCRAMAQLITIGSTDFIFVYISDGPDKGCIDFANEMFAKYSDRVGVLCTHKYLEADLDLDDMGEYMLKKIVEPNENVKLVLCGHESVAGFVTTKLSDGREIVQIIADYQDASNSGTLMYLQIDETENTLTAISYSPLSGSYDGYRDIETDQFRISLPW